MNASSATAHHRHRPHCTSSSSSGAGDSINENTPHAICLNNLRGKQPYRAAKKGCSGEKSYLYQFLRHTLGVGLEQILVHVAVESYNIVVLTLYARLSTAIQTDC